MRYALILFAFVLSGCATVTDKVSSGVNAYCERPLSSRQLIRQSVNARLEGHRIEVTCAGDE